MKKCIFCNIPKEEILMSTEYCYVIVNFFQEEKVESVMVIPKEHMENIEPLYGETFADFFETIIRTRNILENKTGKTQFTILINEGAVAGQTVPHLHAHIFAREEGDGIVNVQRPEKKKIWPERLDELKKMFS